MKIKSLRKSLENQRGSDTKKVLTLPKFFYFPINNIIRAGSEPLWGLTPSVQTLMFYTFLILTTLASCSPTVRLDTPEPVKINVNMKVDVTTEAKEGSSATVKTTDADQTPLQRRRQRMAEIQDLKNNRIAGEANNGLLSIVKFPDDPKWKEYAEKLVHDENTDREAIFEQEAKVTGKPVELIAKDFAKKMRDSSFPNEWIQTESGEWKQN